MFGVHISDLHPQGDPFSRRVHRQTADLEKPVAQEEHQAGYIRVTELPADGETQGFSVEPVAASEVCGTQKNSAAKDFLRTSSPPAALPSRTPRTGRLAALCRGATRSRRFHACWWLPWR